MEVTKHGMMFAFLALGYIYSNVQQKKQKETLSQLHETKKTQKQPMLIHLSRAQTIILHNSLSTP